MKRAYFPYCTALLLIFLGLLVNGAENNWDNVHFCYQLPNERPVLLAPTIVVARRTGAHRLELQQQAVIYRGNVLKVVSVWKIDVVIEHVLRGKPESVVLSYAQFFDNIGLPPTLGPDRLEILMLRSEAGRYRLFSDDGSCRLPARIAGLKKARNSTQSKPIEDLILDLVIGDDDPERATTESITDSVWIGKEMRRDLKVSRFLDGILKKSSNDEVRRSACYEMISSFFAMRPCLAAWKDDDRGSFHLALLRLWQNRHQLRHDALKRVADLQNIIIGGSPEEIGLAREGLTILLSSEDQEVSASAQKALSGSN